MSVYYSIGASILALVFVGWHFFRVKKQETGDEKMNKIAKHIREGASTYLKRQYRSLAIFAAVVAVLLLFVDGPDGVSTHGWKISLAFIYGAVSSGLAGFIGMYSATLANVRTTQAAKSGLGKALSIAFSSGSVGISALN